jgi:hypothetical protein
MDEVMYVQNINLKINMQHVEKKIHNLHHTFNMVKLDRASLRVFAILVRKQPWLFVTSGKKHFW